MERGLASISDTKQGGLEDSFSVENNPNKPEEMFDKQNKVLHNSGQLQGPEAKRRKQVQE